MMQIFADLYHTSLIDMSVPEASPEGLFFSSPGIDDTRRGPEDEVPVLVARAIQVTTLGPAVDNFMALHKDAFLSMFARQINLIKSRSQAFEDGHITVFDKTLLTLTQNGTDLDNPAAIQYYCEEFLGIHFGASTGEASRVLSQAIDVPESLIKGLVIRPVLWFGSPDFLTCRNLYHPCEQRCEDRGRGRRRDPSREAQHCGRRDGTQVEAIVGGL